MGVQMRLIDRNEFCAYTGAEESEIDSWLKRNSGSFQGLEKSLEIGNLLRAEDIRHRGHG